MSPEHHNIRTEQLLRSLLKSGALIQRNALMNDWPAFPRGDHRKRPLFWVNRADVEALLADGVLTVTKKGVGLADATRRRLLYGQSAREVVEEKTFVYGSSKRPVRRNVRGLLILRLARQVDRKGNPLLSDAHITAGHRYTMDLLRSGEAQVGTTDFTLPKVDGTRRHDGAERAAISRLDGQQSLRAAREALGEDLSRLLNKVCGATETLDAIERAERWSKGTGLSVLKIALDLLSRHYGTVPGVPEAQEIDPRPQRKLA